MCIFASNLNSHIQKYQYHTGIIDIVVNVGVRYVDYLCVKKYDIS